MDFQTTPNVPLGRLLSEMVDGEPSPANLEELAGLLRGDPQARGAYIQWMSLHAELLCRIPRQPAADADAPQSAAAITTPPLPGSPLALGEGKPGGKIPSSSPVLGFLGDLGRQGWGIVSNHVTFFLALAVLLVVALVFAGIWLHGKMREEEVAQVPATDSPLPSGEGTGVRAAPVARLTRIADCRWADQALEPGDLVKSGQSLHLASGVAEMKFDIGVRVILQGPASLEVQSADSASLSMGKLTAEITNKAARGFKILTPEATLVDQGTEFGVEVTRGGSSRVHVFQGEVDVALNQNNRSAIQPQKLTANCGARLEGKPSSMTLLRDTGESFIRSIDQAQRDQHTVAYWRFEDQPLGIVLPDTNQNTYPVRATMDSSFNGNDLFTYTPRHGPQFSGDVPAAIVPQTGVANLGCLDNTVPPQGETTRDVYTHSQFSHAAPLDLQKITPAAWTIEASVKPKRLHCGPQTFVCRDALGGQRPWLVFQITDRDQFAVEFGDVQKRFHQAVAEDLAIRENRWYHLAAVSDGHALKLFADCQDGRGYQLRASTELPKTDSTALGKSDDLREWDIGRIRTQADAIEQWFQGWIDEVRISDVALQPTEFLFAAKK